MEFIVTEIRKLKLRLHLLVYIFLVKFILKIIPSLRKCVHKIINMKTIKIIVESLLSVDDTSSVLLHYLYRISFWVSLCQDRFAF